MIVDGSVAIIKKYAFYNCRRLVYVLMGDNMKRIEEIAFGGCCALRFIQISKTLEYIG